MARRDSQEDEREGDRAHGVVVLQVRLCVCETEESITEHLFTPVNLSDGAFSWGEIQSRPYLHAGSSRLSAESHYFCNLGKQDETRVNEK